MWEKIGATKGYQKLITVDADTVQNPKYKTITDHTYYRQRITLHKQDEDGKGLGGIKFTLSAIIWMTYIPLESMIAVERVLILRMDMLPQM
ncbi:MAG: hypothetical protein ACLSD6_02090 [Clostridium sp.]